MRQLAECSAQMQYDKALPCLEETPVWRDFNNDCLAEGSYCWAAKCPRSVSGEELHVILVHHFSC